MKKSSIIVAGFVFLAGLTGISHAKPTLLEKQEKVVCNGKDTASHPVWETDLIHFDSEEIGKVKFCSNGDFKATLTDAPEIGDYHLCASQFFIFENPIVIDSIFGAQAGDDLLFRNYTPSDGAPAYLTDLEGFPGFFLNLVWVELDDGEDDPCQFEDELIAGHGAVFTDLLGP